MAQQAEQSNFWRIVHTALLIYIALLLMDYAPLVPRAVVFMDDVHTLREKSASWEKTADEIKKSLSIVEKLVSYFKAEAGEEQDVREWANQYIAEHRAEVSEEPDVRAWANQYIAEQQAKMSAVERRTGRRPRPDRVAIREAVRAKFGEGSGRVGGFLTWLRILYWVAVIIAAL